MDTIDPTDAIFTIGFALFTSLLTEAISWLLIYRTDDYKRLQNEMRVANKKNEKLKDNLIFGTTKSKAQEKKLQASEDHVKQISQELTKSKMSSTLFVGLFMIIFMSLLSSAYQGVVVAKLPFEPFFMIKGISHRNITGDDMTDCSMIFIYIISNISLRPIISKLLGSDGPRVSMQQNGLF